MTLQATACAEASLSAPRAAKPHTASTHRSRSLSPCASLKPAVAWSCLAPCACTACAKASRKAVDGSTVPTVDDRGAVWILQLPLNGMVSGKGVDRESDGRARGC